MPTNYHNVGEESSALCIATVGVTPDGHVFPVRCKRWACPICAPINALHAAIKTANGVYALASSGVMVKFATITQPGNIKSPRLAYAILDNQWDKFRNRWQYWARKAGIPNTYAAFVEGQSRRSDMPHFHIIGSALPKRWVVRDWATASGFGYQADVQKIQANAGVAWYVSKYSTKGSDAEYIPRGFRRVRYSQDWPDMLFEVDLQEDTAIVRKQHESYASWLVRAVSAFQVEPSDVMLQVQNLMDMTEGSKQADNAAQALLQVQSWT